MRIYQTLVVSVLLYASETWTLLAADVKTLEAFHMKCQRQILRIRWQDHVRNAARTGLRPVMESIRRWCKAIFGHVARMSPNIPAHRALRLQVEASVGRRPDRDWVRSSGCPRNRWIDQRHQDHQRPPADLWRAAIRRGHTGPTLRSLTTTQWWRRRRGGITAEALGDRALIGRFILYMLITTRQCSSLGGVCTVSMLFLGLIFGVLHIG